MGDTTDASEIARLREVNAELLAALLGVLNVHHVDIPNIDDYKVPAYTVARLAIAKAMGD